MKKNYLTLPILLASLFAVSQNPPHNSYKKKQIAQTDIQTLFSYYAQDGEHSAITGGIGTEKLTVLVNELIITHKADSTNTFELNAGVDVITSASKDNIDFEMSSASRIDARIYANPGYTRTFKKNITASISTGLSIESDYTSLPFSLSVSKAIPSRSEEISATFKCFFDDLRWGRLDIDIQRPVMLIYPSELRYKEWFTIHKRNSYNFQLAYFKAINPKLQLALFPEVVYQHGLLSTPYHRVFFKDVSIRVENLPLNRWKVPIAIQLNAFATDNVIIKGYYRFYVDDFGILAHTLQIELPVEVSQRVTLSPLVRLYLQRGSKYFGEYKEHNISDEFYTSDHDLSTLSSYKVGLGFKYTPDNKMWKHLFFHELNLHYSYYHRSDNLYSHVLSFTMALKNLHHNNQIKDISTGRNL